MGKHTELIDGGLRSLVGTRKFYKKVLLVAVPIMIQNGITNFVSLLDNIMVWTGGTGADVRGRDCESAGLYF